MPKKVVAPPVISKQMRGQIKKINGVIDTGGDTYGKEYFFVYLSLDTVAVREAVQAVIGDKLPKEKVKFIVTGAVSAGSKKW